MIKFKGLFKVGAFILALLALIIISSNGAKAQYSGTNGRIFYSGLNSGQHPLYSVFANGTDSYNHGNYSACPRFLSVSTTSPLAGLVSNVGGTCRIYTRSVAAGASETLNLLANYSGVSSYQEYHPVFSKDGTKVAYLRGDPNGNGDRQLFIANVDGSNLRQMTSFNYTDPIGGADIGVDSVLNYPTWAPDSNDTIYIHYCLKVSSEAGCTATGRTGIIGVSTAGTGSTNCEWNDACIDANVSFTTAKSFDGNGMDMHPTQSYKFVYAQTGKIYTLLLGFPEAPTTIRDQVVCTEGDTPEYYAYYSPYYSPDGNYIVAVRYCGEPYDPTKSAIVYMNSDGTGSDTVVFSGAGVQYGYTVPFWSNITTTYNSTPTPSPTPAAPDTSGSIFKQRDIRLPMMLVLMGLVVLSASGYGLYKEAKRRKKI